MPLRENFSKNEDKTQKIETRYHTGSPLQVAAVIRHGHYYKSVDSADHSVPRLYAMRVAPVVSLKTKLVDGSNFRILFLQIG